MTRKLVEMQMEPALMRNPGQLKSKLGGQQLPLSPARLCELSYKSEVKRRAGQVQMDAQEGGWVESRSRQMKGRMGGCQVRMRGWEDKWVSGLDE